MNRLTEDQCTLHTIGLCLLGSSLWLGMGSTAHAEVPMGARALSPVAYHSSSDAPIVVCGGQTGHRSLEIRGTDVATLWRSAYHMLFPTSALANDKNKMDRAKALPDKGPTWGISLDHGDALLTVQTKW